jgi:hypothetical protein
MKVLRIVFPHKSIIGAGVSGTVDATYLASWLTDGLPGYPAVTSGAMSLTVAPLTPLDVDIVAVCNHNIPADATITVGGDVTATIPTAAQMPDLVNRNWFVKLDAVAEDVDALTLSVTSGDDPIVVGEFYAGLSWTPTNGVKHGRQLESGQQFSWEGEYSSLAPYWKGVRKPRRYRIELLLEDAEVEELQLGEIAQRNGNRPCLVIMDETNNDAMLAVFSFSESTDGGNHQYAIEIVEIPSVDWMATEAAS